MTFLTSSHLVVHRPSWLMFTAAHLSHKAARRASAVVPAHLNVAPDDSDVSSSRHWARLAK